MEKQLKTRKHFTDRPGYIKNTIVHKIRFAFIFALSAVNLAPLPKHFTHKQAVIYANKIRTVIIGSNAICA